jgi:hypothetical protein
MNEYKLWKSGASCYEEMKMNLKNMSRVIGGIWIFTSILWAGLGITGIFWGIRWLENTETKLDDNLSSAIESLESVYLLIDESTDIISSTQHSLLIAQLSVSDTSSALMDLSPLLWKTGEVVTIEVPSSLDDVQNSIPSLVETAKSVDETLTWLSNIEFTIPNPFGSDWRFDLGIHYNPEISLDLALENMGKNLEGVPSDLRALDESLREADSNLFIISDDLIYLADDIESMSEQVGEVVPQMETLASDIDALQGSFEKVQTSIPESMALARKVMIFILCLLILTQIPFVFMGGLLLRGVLCVSRLPEGNKERFNI